MTPRILLLAVAAGAPLFAFWPEEKPPVPPAIEGAGRAPLKAPQTRPGSVVYWNAIVVREPLAVYASPRAETPLTLAGAQPKYGEVVNVVEAKRGRYLLARFERVEGEDRF